MALTLKDRIWTRVDSSGLGDLIVGVNQLGYSGWDSIPLGDSVYYCLVDDVYWEVGHGQYLESDGNRVITRNVLASNTGSKINIATSKSATVFCTYPAEKSVYLDLNNNIELPNSDAVLKYIAGIQVTAPAVVTEAVIVDGTAGADGDLAGLLNVYRKDEIDDQQEVQDVQIEKNKQDIVELEEEIEALAPSFDRGHWKHDEREVAGGAPDTGSYYIVADTQITDKFEDTTQIYFNNKDDDNPPHTHTFEDVEEGMYVEMFEEADSSFLLGTVETVTKGNTHTVIDVTVVKSEGGVSGGSSRVRVKIFKMSEIDASTLMPKAGGVFTGGVGISWKMPGALTESFTVSDNDDNKVVTIWNNGSVQTTFKNFKDNDLVTKAYVDKKTDRTSVTCEQNWNNASWNIDNMVDALVSQIKVHNDRTALVLNKNGTDTDIIMDWEKELAPYPSYFGIKIDNKIHYVEVEFTGKGGSNNRGYNFKILDHNLPETVANDTVVGICANYTHQTL